MKKEEATRSRIVIRDWLAGEALGKGSGECV